MQTATHPRTSSIRVSQSASASGSDAPFYTRPAFLWTVQGAVAAIFLFAGVMKLVMPAADLDEQSPLPVLFLRFIGACETLGALGLVLPGILRIRTGLTPLAAAGLVIIMVGAVVLTVADAGVLPALVPLAVGCGAGFIAYRRSLA